MRVPRRLRPFQRWLVINLMNVVVGHITSFLLALLGLVDIVNDIVIVDPSSTLGLLFVILLQYTYHIRKSCDFSGLVSELHILVSDLLFHELDPLFKIIILNEKNSFWDLVEGVDLLLILAIHLLYYE